MQFVWALTLNANSSSYLRIEHTLALLMKFTQKQVAY